MTVEFRKILFSVLVIVFFSACSDEVISTDCSEGKLGGITEEIELGEVEILLGVSMAEEQTRAPINSDNNWQFATNQNDTLGVFALATANINENLSYGEKPSAINWAGAWKVVKDEEEKPHLVHYFNENYSVYLNNEKATIGYARDERSGNNYSIVKWLGSATKCYPLRSLHKYSFYAYNPRVDSITYEKDRVIAVMRNLKGCEDVIWGCIEPLASDQYFPLAYSADYFRQKYVKEHIAEINRQMTFQFKHKMMLLKFEIVAGAPDETLSPTLRNYDNAYKTKVHSISIVNVPDELQLVLADKSAMEIDGANGNMQGILTYSKERNKTYFLKENARNEKGELVLDTVFTPVSPKPKYPDYIEGERDERNVPDTTSIGNGIMLPVLTDMDRVEKPYVMEVLLEYPVGSFYRKRFKLEATKGSFQAGEQYTICLKIYCPDDIPISSSSSDWEKIDAQNYLDYIDPAKKEALSTNDAFTEINEYK